MNRNYEIVRGTIIVVFFILLAGAVLVRWLKRSRDDPAALIIKWVITVPLIVVSLLSVKWFSWCGPFLIVICSIAISVLWAPSIACRLIKPLTSAIDGGDEEPQPAPAYSAVRALRNKGKYLEAVAAVRQQLAKFPNDLEGVLLLAAIQAENLGDLPSAEITLNRFCERPGQSPPQVAAVLCQLADWHLKLAGDRESARQALEKIAQRFPESDLAKQAAQRIAHLAETEYLLSPHDRQSVHVPEGVKNIGLLPSCEHLLPAEADPAELAADFVSHLETHPLDTEAREKLAVLYAEHFGRLDLATDQLQQLIQLRKQSPREVAHWLNLLADLQIRGGAGYDTVRGTLLTIEELFPQSAVAEMARNRIDRLRLEFKAKEKSQAVPLGSYEQYLGLKMKR
jgi:tetratricopeptide (TPR) repeat protein